MKNLRFIFVTMLLCLGFAAALTSCSDKEDEPSDSVASGAAAKVAGTYSGDMGCIVMNTPFNFEDMTIEVESVDDDTVEINIPSFGPSSMNMKMPALTVPGVKVTGEDGSYTLATTEFDETTDEGKSYSGKISGSYNNNELKISYELRYGNMPMPMVCSYTGVKK